ncbi:MAG TPA: hypothetical protein VGU68_03215, partial [Ktedonobacteraceae bacterium]|nr:hypothetical protein [Ktedonobacteraceae bacterium]
MVSSTKAVFLRDRRWQIVIAGLLVQVVVMVMAFVSLQQSGRPDVTLAPVAGKTDVCRITSVAPFTDAWVNGIQPGMLVRALSSNAEGRRYRDVGTLVDCKPTAQSVFVEVINHSSILHLNTDPRSLDIVNQVIALLLVVIFNLMGITIFLRTTKRPVARTAYALFYAASILFFLVNLNSTLPNNILLYVLGQITWGLAATFVYLLPRPAASKEKQRPKIPISPYTPLIVSIALTILSIPVLILLPAARFAMSLITSGYALLCMIAICWMMLRGMRRLSQEEKRTIRIIAAGIVFLLLMLAFNRNIVNYSSFVINSFTHLNTFNSIPLLILPVICGYTLIRHQFLGTTSLLSRQVMRALLWMLLGSFFVIPSVNIMHILENNVPGLGENRYYFYAGLLWLSLLLFPLFWSKVRNFGDQVFYHDFYEYNRSLRELSAELTRLQHLDQICTFVLPHLAQLLNARGAALLVCTGNNQEKLSSDSLAETTWRIYRNADFLPTERLTRIADLALTHQLQRSAEPLLLDGVLLLALYDG